MPFQAFTQGSQNHCLRGSHVEPWCILFGSVPVLGLEFRGAGILGGYEQACNNQVHAFKGPCAQIVYTLAFKQASYSHFGPKVYTVWAHGP